MLSSLSKKLRRTSWRSFLPFEDSETFYRYTEGRYVYNEAQQLSVRYAKFNIPALKQAAAHAIGAKECVNMVKLQEGAFSKVFCLTFDHGRDLIAKIPTDLLTPPRLRTASEVATMDYARSVLGLPVPAVLGWSSSASDTDVGAEYILMEKVRGTELYNRYETGIIGNYVEQLLDQILAIEHKFAARRFSQIGSLYYKEDVDASLQGRRLYAEGEPDDAGSERFRIGPLVDWDLWRGTRASLDVYRGPWPDPVSFLRDILHVEREWLRLRAKPRAPGDPFIRSQKDNDPKTHIQLVDDLLALIPHLVFPPELCQPVFWHTDLHRGNIMIPAEGDPTITGILDWQSMGIMPLFMQAIFPMCFEFDVDERIIIPAEFRVPEVPANIDELPREEQRLLRIHCRIAGIRKLYEGYIRNYSPSHHAAMSYPHYELIMTAISSGQRTWYQGAHNLREAIVQLHDVWEDIAPGVTFPIDLQRPEYLEHRVEFCRLGYYDYCMARLRKELVLEADGWVTHDRYRQVKGASDESMKRWSEADCGGPYPFQDGGWSWYLS